MYYSKDMETLIRTQAADYPFAPWTGGHADFDAYYASGLNTAANIKAFAAIGHDVGVAFPELYEAGIVALEGLAGSGVKVFVDSGAFSEVDFTDSGPVVVKPLDDAHWRRYLGVCLRLAKVLGSDLCFCAPDMVGHQTETLARLYTYAPELRALDATGARVLVPVQKGAITQAKFWIEAQAILGDGAWIPALPCAKSATTADEAIAFADAAKPTELHLLGLGNRNTQAKRFLNGIRKASPGVVVTCDSCLLAATCGSKRRYGVARARGKELERKGMLHGVTERTIFQVALAFGSFSA